MSEDYTKNIMNLEKEIQENKIELAKLQERKENLKKEKEQVLKELKNLGVDVSGLDDKIAELEIDITAVLKECEKELE